MLSEIAGIFAAIGETEQAQVMDEALAIVPTIPSVSLRVMALAYAVPPLDPERLRRVLTFALTMDCTPNDGRCDIAHPEWYARHNLEYLCRALLAALQRVSDEEFYPLCSLFLENLTRLSRYQALEFIGPLLSRFLETGGEKTIADLRQALEDVMRWWP